MRARPSTKPWICDSLPMPLGGLGIAIISTSSGLLTQKECLDRGIGGEIVAFVW